MDEIPNRIKINQRYWVVIQPNKCVLGGFFIDPNIHITIMYGIKSGILDLHLTKNKKEGKADHFKILKIAHQDLFRLFPVLFRNATYSFFANSNTLDLDWLEKNNFKIFFVRGYDSVFENKIDNEIEKILNVFE